VNAVWKKLSTPRLSDMLAICEFAELRSVGREVFPVYYFFCDFGQCDGL
jgi:hypothetical protein